MAKVSVRMSATLRVGDPQYNEYVKVEIGLDEIDSEQDVDAQLRQGAATIGGTYSVVSTLLERRIKELKG